MKLKFGNTGELINWLISQNHLIKKKYSEVNLAFYGLKFSTQEELLDFMQKHGLIEYLYGAKEEPDSIFQKVSEFRYEFDSVILNRNLLESIKSDSFVDPQILANRLLTIKEVGKILGLTRPSVYKLFELGELPYFTILSQKKVKLSDLMMFINKNRG